MRAETKVISVIIQKAFSGRTYNPTTIVMSVQQYRPVLTVSILYIGTTIHSGLSIRDIQKIAEDLFRQIGNIHDVTNRDSTSAISLRFPWEFARIRSWTSAYSLYVLGKLYLMWGPPWRRVARIVQHIKYNV